MCVCAESKLVSVFVPEQQKRTDDAYGTVHRSRIYHLRYHGLPSNALTARFRMRHALIAGLGPPPAFSWLWKTPNVAASTSAQKLKTCSRRRVGNVKRKIQSMRLSVCPSVGQSSSCGRPASSLWRVVPTRACWSRCWSCVDADGSGARVCACVYRMCSILPAAPCTTVAGAGCKTGRKMSCLGRKIQPGCASSGKP